MRLYTFNNFYLSQIQIGIQSLHSTVELFNKYKHNYNMMDIITNWSEKHKTVICLNGGNAGDLQNIIATLDDLNKQQLDLPYSYFREDNQSLNGCLTSVAVIVPEHIYNFVEARDFTNKVVYETTLTYPEYCLYNLIKSRKLA